MVEGCAVKYEERIELFKKAVDKINKFPFSEGMTHPWEKWEQEYVVEAIFSAQEVICNRIIAIKDEPSLPDYLLLRNLVFVFCRFFKMTNEYREKHFVSAKKLAEIWGFGERGAPRKTQRRAKIYANVFLAREMIKYAMIHGTSNAKTAVEVVKKLKKDSGCNYFMGVPLPEIKKEQRKPIDKVSGKPLYENDYERCRELEKLWNEYEIGKALKEMKGFLKENSKKSKEELSELLTDRMFDRYNLEISSFFYRAENEKSVFDLMYDRIFGKK